MFNTIASCRSCGHSANFIRRLRPRQGYITLYDDARRHFDNWAPGGTWEKGAGPCERAEAERRLADPIIRGLAKGHFGVQISATRLMR